MDRIWIVMVVASLVGCVGPEAPGQRSQAIVNALGEDTDTLPKFPAVVSLERNRSGRTNCSGTLISPSHVLTAAHCVSDQPVTRVGFGASHASIGSRGVAACWIHPEYNLSAGAEPDAECGTLRERVSPENILYDISP